MSLDQAIVTLQAEVDAFKQGMKDQPAESSQAWFLLLAKSLGLSLLKRMKQEGLEMQPKVAEALSRSASRASKLSTGEVSEL